MHNCTLGKILWITNNCTFVPALHKLTGSSGTCCFLCTDSQGLLEHAVSYSMRIWLYNALGYDEFAYYFASTVELVLNWQKAMWSSSNTGIMSPADSQNDVAQVHPLQSRVHYGCISTRTLPGKPRAGEGMCTQLFCKTSSTAVHSSTVLDHDNSSPRQLPCMIQR